MRGLVFISELSNSGPVVKKDAYSLFFFVNCDVSIVFKLYKSE